MKKHEILTDEELEKINKLNEYVPSITKLFLEWKKNRAVPSQIANDIKVEIKKIIKKGETPSREKNAEYIRAQELLEQTGEEFKKICNNWNGANEFIYKKYNYIKLSSFLNKNELGYQMSKSLAWNTQLSAEAEGVIILHILAEGDFTLNQINIYPECWLNSFFKISV